MRQAFGDQDDEDGRQMGRLAVWRSVYIPDETARLIMDALLGNLVCGWLPPMRPKMLRTLKAPEYRTSPCTHPGTGPRSRP